MPTHNLPFAYYFTRSLLGIPLKIGLKYAEMKEKDVRYEWPAVYTKK